MAEGEVEVPDELPGWLVIREWLVVMRKLALRRSGYLTSGSSTITRISSFFARETDCTPVDFV